jgi:hypothetical protein
VAVYDWRGEVYIAGSRVVMGTACTLEMSRGAVDVVVVGVVMVAVVAVFEAVVRGGTCNQAAERRKGAPEVRMVRLTARPEG